MNRNKIFFILFFILIIIHFFTVFSVIRLENESKLLKSKNLDLHSKIKFFEESIEEDEREARAIREENDNLKTRMNILNKTIVDLNSYIKNLEVNINISSLLYINSLEDRVVKPFAGNPVFGPSGSGFDSDGVGEPFVLFYNGKYYMAYEAWNGSEYSIGLVESEDGIKWTNRTQIMSKGDAGDFDEHGCATPALHMVDRYFYLFYAGIAFNHRSIGLARATLIGGPYTNLGQIIPRGGAESWDEYKVDTGALVYFKGEYRVYYEGAPEGIHYHQMGYAHASDIEGPYTKYSGNPVMTSGNPTMWDNAIVKDFTVLNLGDILYATYWGRPDDPASTQSAAGGLGFAYSMDGKEWVKSPKNPVLKRTGIPGEFSYGITNPALQSYDLVNLWNNVWAIYFEGGDYPEGKIGLAWLMHREQKIKTRQKIIDVSSIGHGAIEEAIFNNLGVENLAITIRVTYGAGATSGVRVWLLASHDRSNFDNQNTNDAWTYFDPSFSAGVTRQRTVPIDTDVSWLKVAVENLDGAVDTDKVEVWVHRTESYGSLMGS